MALTSRAGIELSRDAAIKASRDADEIELEALRSGSETLVPSDESLYDETISEEGFEDEGIASAEEADYNLDDIDPIRETSRLDLLSDTLVSMAGSVIQERARLLREYYPFEFRANSLAYRGSRTFVYEFCLAVVQAVTDQQVFYLLGPHFERLAGVVMSIFLGPPATFLRTGVPAQREADPPDIRKAVDLLKEQMPDEWELDSNSPIEEPHDGGVDVVVWKKFDDRIGSLIFTGNCTCGRNWLDRRKHFDRPSERLGNLLSLPKPYHLHDFFALPLHLSERREWLEASTAGRLVLDRVRLTLIAESAPPRVWSEQQEKLPTSLRALIKASDARFRPRSRRT